MIVSRVFRKFILAWTETNGEGTNYPQAKYKKSKDQKCLPIDVALIVELYNKLPYYKNDCRVYHCMQPESMDLEIVYKAAK